MCMLFYNSEGSPGREVWYLVSVVRFMQGHRAFLPDLGQVSPPTSISA